MFIPANIVATALAEELVQNYRDIFGNSRPEYASTIRAVTKLVIERIANSDALYHDSDHTVMVTVVGQAILKGRALVEEITDLDWLHFSVACLCHDVGYLRGLCPGDTDTTFVINEEGDTVTAPRGASDAFLTPHHIERGKIFVRDRCRYIDILDAERITRAIELTRFPVPDDDDHTETDTEAGLLRAADLIGQLADPFYPRKLNALFHEFCETGVADRLEFRSPTDLADHYPSFFWNAVEPYIGKALEHLSRTVEGKQWVASLYAHVFVEEHKRARLGPQRASTDRKPQKD
ncbi:MAG: metal-dependent phosphohydrolase [Geminicoccaceae bacterium]